MDKIDINNITDADYQLVRSLGEEAAEYYQDDAFRFLMQTVEHRIMGDVNNDAAVIEKKAALLKKKADLYARLRSEYKIPAAYVPALVKLREAFPFWNDINTLVQKIPVYLSICLPRDETGFIQTDKTASAVLSDENRRIVRVKTEDESRITVMSADNQLCRIEVEVADKVSRAFIAQGERTYVTEPVHGTCTFHDMPMEDFFLLLENSSMITVSLEQRGET